MSAALSVNSARRGPLTEITDLDAPTDASSPATWSIRRVERS